MNAFIRIASISLLPASLLYVGQAPSSSAPTAPNSTLSAMQVYPFSTDLTPPRIQPVHFALAPEKGCKKSPEMNASVLLVLDAKGRPHFTSFRGGNLPQWAVPFLKSEHYFPATLNQKPAAVALNVDIRIDTCRDKSSSNDEPFNQMHLWRQPDLSFGPAGLPITQVFLNPDGSIEKFSTDQVQNVEFVSPGRVTAPKLISAPEAMFPEEARPKTAQGTCQFAVIVGKNGLVQQVGLLRATDSIFVPNALQAIRQYHFQPATSGGNPVAVEIMVEVNFRHY